MVLTNSQKEAVQNKDGITLINAGAGSGKSSSYTARIANLVANHGVDPSSILGLTFTNEAATNMKVKLAKLIGKSKSEQVELSTFHSFAYKILKSRYAHVYSNRKIVEQWWKFSKLYDLIDPSSMKNPIGLALGIEAGDLAGFFSYQKANMVKPGMDVIIDERVSYVAHVERKDLQQAYDVYGELVKNARVMEFDDMLMDFYYYLKEDKDLLKEIKMQYDYVMVDEFQDTNSVNMEILKLISDDNLFVVGDFRQGVYGFINANIDNILTFQAEFSNVNLIEFKENFRSTKTIVEFCNSIIDVAPVEKYKRFAHQVAARKEVGDPIQISYHRDETSEVRSIAADIDELMSTWEYNYSDFAILCRTNASLGMYESVLADLDIPCDISSSRSFFDRREVSDLLAYAAHTIDETDNLSLNRIINSPNRFVSKATINGLDKYAFDNNISLEQSLTRMDSGRSASALSQLSDLFEDLRDKEEINAAKFLKDLYVKIKYKDHLAKKSTNHSELILRTEAIERLFDIAKKFNNIKSFLGHISVIKNNNKKFDEGAVKLMTVHSSKGLEFEHVYVTGVTSENFPHQMNTDYEEERRLLYVALSRAKQTLKVSSHVFVGSKQEPLKPSPFMVDLLGDSITALRKEIMHGNDYGELSYTIETKTLAKTL